MQKRGLLLNKWRVGGTVQAVDHTWLLDFLDTGARTVWHQPQITDAEVEACTWPKQINLNGNTFFCYSYISICSVLKQFILT